MRLLLAFLCIVTSVLAVSVYEIDRREKSTAGTFGARLNALEVAVVVSGYSDNRDRIDVPCLGSGRTAVIVTMGQSNATNSGDTIYTAKRDVLNFNINDGKCYRAKDPLLGTTGIGGNFATQLGDILIERGDYDRIVIVPVAVDSTHIEQWAPGGELHFRALMASARMFSAGMSPDYVLWQQGEGNKPKSQHDIERYTMDVRAIVQSLRRSGSKAPFFVALTTICGGTPYEPTRQAQRAAISPELGIFLGPDTDALGPEFRYDGCHFNRDGQIRQAELWVDAITRANGETANEYAAPPHHRSTFGRSSSNATQ
jgi:hypothetical protein